MRIVLFGEAARLGVLEGGHVLDLAAAYTESLRRAGASSPEQVAAERLGSSLGELIANGSSALDAAEEALDLARRDGFDPAWSLPLEQTRLRAPWPGRRIACVGGNYADHLAGMTGGFSMEAVTAQARENGQWGFWKVPSEVAGPGDELPYPRRTEYLDYEGEAAVVISRRGKDIPADRFEDYVFGVTLVNDVSIRDNMGRPFPMSYNLAKNFDGCVAMGPVIVVGEQLSPLSLEVETKVNGETRQRFDTSAMIFSFPEVLEFLSRDLTFVPGDVISGGTAKGTAADSTPRPAEGEKRPRELFLDPGDTVEVSSPQVGVLTNTVS